MKSEKHAERRFKGLYWGFVLKATFTLCFVLFGLNSCSILTKPTNTLPEKVEYTKIEFKSCNPEISGHLCLKNEDAISITLDLKKCQAQNNLLRELHGN
ncbi:MAG: hypothetical protein Unbinned834contig1000_42 [Prokaryotic dsDNA virus sp.]|nr:MAG: hypothetical protein Unbinned834contig1000_42 [Prokaryotic dsDNA virus sp.]|tara:strand:- start:32797 stop:33093 length:297 start_codon:yes stop_codon:yes gene_type:complete